MVKVASRRQGEGWICDIEVEHAGERTKHVVTVSRSELERWGRGADVDDLVKRSFEFLLERERPSSILRRFELSVIQRYFPEYDERIRG
ncbi:MAG TPA: hypothetical protein VNA65_03315 [Candidatus Dormibacteraeota bacterium]|nr:hypothetical protein [Candidatus Dormibacteraeota bacterium]